MEDLEIRALEKGIEKALNASRICPEVKRLVLAELLTNFTADADKTINEQLNKNKQDTDSSTLYEEGEKHAESI